MHTGMLVALASVAPINQENARPVSGPSLGTIHLRRAENRFMFGEVTASMTLQSFLICTATVHIQSE